MKKSIKKILRKISPFLAVILLIVAILIVVLHNSNRDEAQQTIIDGDTQVITEDGIISISHVEQIIEPASELITTKYYYKDADSSKNSKDFLGVEMPFTTNEVVFTYEGTVSVGVEFSEIQVISVDNQNKKITIKMPDVKILANEIDMDSFEVPYEKTSIFNNTNMEDYTDLIATLKQEKEEEVTANTEIMDTAKSNAENIIRDFLNHSSDTEDYQVIFQ